MGRNPLPQPFNAFWPESRAVGLRFRSFRRVGRGVREEGQGSQTSGHFSPKAFYFSDLSWVFILPRRESKEPV